MHNKVFPIYKKYITFLKKEYKGKVDITNNKQKIIGFGANKFEKRKYRTNFGFFNHIVVKAHFFDREMLIATNKLTKPRVFLSKALYIIFK